MAKIVVISGKALYLHLKISHTGHQLIWLERQTGSLKVIGSSPICSTNNKLSGYKTSSRFFY